MSSSPQVSTSPTYIVISPARDEEEHIETTLKAVIAQTMRPAEWIIVNDGSKDRTGAIADAYAQAHPWIRVLHLEDRGYRSPGTGVISAFNEGYRTISRSEWEFLVKLDADLDFSENYFESCFRHFRDDQKLGVAGGAIVSRNVRKGTTVIEETPRFHVRGATKIYRRACWNEIGGLIPAAGWDTWDEVKANYFGWKTATLENVHLTQLRETGAVQGQWRDFVKNGTANYICGYHPLFMLAKCLRRLSRSGARISGLALLYGYVSSPMRRIKQVHEKEVVRYLRQEQFKRLFGLQSMWR
jgi:glycosyltransferase involved in cell wall biosynthesis